MMDTKLTLDQIHLSLRNSGLWNRRSDIMVPNVSWGLLPYEADFVVISKSGYMTEIEIKRSWEDFKADFKKDHKHDDERVYKFAYCVPKSIRDKVISYIRTQNPDVPDYRLPAVIYYSEDMGIGLTELNYFDNYNSPKRRKFFIEEILKVSRLGQLRYWARVENDYKEGQL